MVDWLLHHGAALLIFIGGVVSSLAAFVAERRASGQRELRRKGWWPLTILAGAFVAGIGALWAGYGQDRLLDYLSGGDSYGYFMPIALTSKNLQFVFVVRGDTPLYDVFADAADVTLWKKLWIEKGWPAQALDPDSGWSDDGKILKSDELWDLHQRTTSNITIGNVGPRTSKFVWQAPIPESDDQCYGFSIWARNGLFNEQLLGHRTASGWAWAWKVERTQGKNGEHIARKLDEYVEPNFPPANIKWARGPS